MSGSLDNERGKLSLIKGSSSLTPGFPKVPEVSQVLSPHLRGARLCRWHERLSASGSVPLFAFRSYQCLAAYLGSYVSLTGSPFALSWFRCGCHPVTEETSGTYWEWATPNARSRGKPCRSSSRVKVWRGALGCLGETSGALREHPQKAGPSAGGNRMKSPKSQARF